MWLYIYMNITYIYIYIYHVMLVAQISLTLSLATHLYRPLLPGGVFQTTSCIGTELLYVVLAGRPTFSRPCEGVHRSTSLICSSLLLHQCSACQVRLTWMGGRWPYSCFFVRCHLHDFSNTARSILV